ncbi:MAG: type IX secretion system sortase PorU [Bacteroidales bacterium]|nr:type IX secretion system sortase PorU [Bacteroidales bacterium]
MIKKITLLFLLFSGGFLAAQAPLATRYAANSVLSTGKWYKIGISETGIYRLSYSDLSSLGMDVDHLDPRQLRVYHNGGGVLNEINSQARFDDLVEIPLFVSGESDGKFDRNDYVLFYARGPVTWKYDTRKKMYQHCPNVYDDYSYAFITVGQGEGKRIETDNQLSALDNKRVTEFLDYQVYDKDKYNIVNGGRTYYGDIIDGNGAVTVDFNFKNIRTNRPCSVSFGAAGRNFKPASFQLKVDDVMLKSYPISQTSSGSDKTFAYEVFGKESASVTSDDIKVTLNHVGVSGTTSLGYVDYIEVNAWRSLAFSGSEMLFRNPEASAETEVYTYQLSGANASVQVWNVTDSVCPTKVKGQLSGSVFEFKVKGNALNEFIAFDGSSYHSPELLGTVANQDLHGDRNYDYLMVVYPDFVEQAERLKAIHAVYDPDLRIKIVTPEVIYNEFACGATDVTAIRDYCRMLYHDDRPLRYLLLFGDASFDFKNRNGVVSFVPTYESRSGADIHTNYVTDDYFCFMGVKEGSLAGSTPDIGAGRFPVSTVEQATQMVDKVEAYLEKSESTMQPWRNTITFMCDDAQSNEFFSHSESYVEQIKSTGGERLVVDKIYLDAYKQEDTPNGQLAPSVNKAVNNRMDKGTLVFNYVGHGGEVQLADERILQRIDVNSWRNGPKYPLMITGTCEFSRYDDHTRTSLGEYAFLNQYGGMIAMFTTSRVTFGNHNKQFISAVYDHLFEIEGGERLRLGDVFRMAKPKGGEYERRYIFFGDPALRLPMPKWTVETTRIDDTIQALQPVVIEGVVKNLQGQVDTTFNGVVYVCVYDKETHYTTFGDEETSPQSFNLRQSVLYNGKTAVVNGHFTVDFIVPRDIAYPYGSGMVSYYATDYVNDASGLYENFVIGGFYKDAVLDEDSPTVRLYIDDEKFVSGGITGDSPTMIAYVEDESGINTTGAGIGHDIVATLSGPTSESFNLNEYFVADVGYQGKGTIQYRMQNLEEGEYTLTLKVWDIYNNSSTTSVNFKVASSDLMVLEDPICAPNPFRDEAWFSFGHNQIGNNMDVEIRIFDMMGRLVTILNERIAGTSARTNPIRWDGCANNGVKLPAGVYVYCVTATNDQHEMATVTSKLIITR